MFKESLRLSLPFYPERILRVLHTTQEGKMKQQEVIASLEKSEGWYIRKAQTYFRYCVHWGLLNSNEECEISALGQAIVLLNNAELGNIVNEMIYYSFASSRKFDALGILVRNLFNRLETSGQFDFTSADVPSIIPKFRGRHDISDLVNILSRIRILKRKRKKGRLVYSVSYYSPTLCGFAVSLLHYIHVNQIPVPHSIKRFDAFRSYWFISKEDFVQYLRRCRAIGLVSYQEYAEINQFQFTLNEITKLTEYVLDRKVAV